MSAAGLAPPLHTFEPSRGGNPSKSSLCTGVAGAEEQFEEALRLNPNLFEAYYHYARTCVLQGKIEQATRLFGKAAEVRPEGFQARILQAQMLAHPAQKEWVANDNDWVALRDHPRFKALMGD